MVRELLSTIDHYFDAYPIPAILLSIIGLIIIMFLSYKIAMLFVNNDTAHEKFLNPILIDEKAKKKKPKPVKSKKNKSENHAKEKEGFEEETSHDIVPEVLLKTDEKVPKPNVSLKQKGRKKQSSKETDTLGVIDQETPIVEVNVEEKIGNDVAAETTSKKKKKNRRKESPEVVYEKKIIEALGTNGVSGLGENKQVEQQVAVEEVKIIITQEQTQEKPIKKKSKSMVDDLSLEKVLSRLILLEDLESEYVNFLSKYAEQVNVKEAKLNDNITHLKKQSQDKDRLVNELNCKVVLLDGKINDELPSVQRQLLEERLQHEAYENTVRQKLAENGKLLTENKQLRLTIEQAQRVQTQSQSYQREAEELKAKLSNMHSSASKEINKKNQELSQLNTELGNFKNQVGQLNHHKIATEEQNRQLSRELELIKQNEKRLVEEIQKSKETVAHVQSEFSRLEKTLHERLQHEQQLQQSSSLVNEKTFTEIKKLEDEARSYRVKYEEIEKIVYDLKSTINSLRTENDALKRQNHELSVHESQKEFETKLHEKERENEKLLQEIHSIKVKIEELSKDSNDDAKIKKLQREYDNYMKQLQIAQAQLEEFDGINNAQKTEISNLEERLKNAVNENASLRDELQKAKNSVLQNHIEHEKENIANVSKLAHSSDDQLIKKLEEQKQKNDELRQRNYKIVEEVRKTEQVTQKMIADLENKLAKSQHDLVHVVVDEFKKVVPKGAKLPNLKNNANSKELVKWVNEIAHFFLSQSTHQTPHQSHHQQQKSTEHHNATVEELQYRLQTYEKALKNLNNHLHAIERVSAAHDKSFKQKIAQLESQLNNRS